MREELYTSREIYFASKGGTRKTCGHQHRTIEAARKCAARLGKGWYAGGTTIRKWKKGVKVTRLGGTEKWRRER